MIWLSSSCLAKRYPPRWKPPVTTYRTAVIFVSLELSRAVWHVTALTPSAAQTMSRHQVLGSDLAGLLERFAELQRKAHAHTGQLARVVVVQEAAL